MEKTAMSKTTDASGIYQPTSDAPNYGTSNATTQFHWSSSGSSCGTAAEFYARSKRSAGTPARSGK